MGHVLASTLDTRVLQTGRDLFEWRSTARLVFLILAILFTVIATNAQNSEVAPLDHDATVVEGTTDTMAYGIGRSLKIKGTVKNGAISLGGDVIVEGVVEGDVASVGGSVIQLKGSRIGGDVIVVGGTYRREDDSATVRNPSSATIMYAGYEQELRNMMRDPSELLTPRWSPAYLGIRLLAILFWFIVSLAITAAMPGTISRGIARLQLTSLRVALIGLLGTAVIGIGVPVSLHYLPTPISVLVGMMALLLLLIAGLFGRVIVYAATGRWLQRRYLPVGKNSESVALLLGTSFWIILSSLPYVWPLVVGAMIVTSLGLALTARYDVGWKRRPEVFSRTL
jgi:hypothetical protein